MARPPKGKPLTYRGLRLDDDVWAECQRLGKEHGTINEGLRVRLLRSPNDYSWVPVRAAELDSAADIERIATSRRRAFKGPLLKPSEKKK